MEEVIEPNDSPIVEPVVEPEDLPPEGETAEEKAERLEAQNKQLFERAKKAEGFEKVDGKWVKKTKAAPAPAAAPVEPSNNLSTKDVLALTQAGVTADDFDEVERVAKILGKPILEALQDKTLKSILKERADERKTAEVTHTRGGARGTAKVSDADILAKAERGEVVDSEEGMQAIRRARQARNVGTQK